MVAEGFVANGAHVTTVAQRRWSGGATGKHGGDRLRSRIRVGELQAREGFETLDVLVNNSGTSRASR